MFDTAIHLKPIIKQILNFQIGLASTYPEPEDKRKWLEDQLYNFNYESSMPVTWPWSELPHIKTRHIVPTKLTEGNSNRRDRK